MITYQQLLENFWNMHNPTTLNQQGADIGTQYRSAIFCFNDKQIRLAKESKKRLEESKKFNSPIVTQILLASEFFPAEDYHQNYHKKNGGSCVF